jgi:hypothetical protein
MPVSGNSFQGSPGDLLSSVISAGHLRCAAVGSALDLQISCGLVDLIIPLRSRVQPARRRFPLWDTQAFAYLRSLRGRVSCSDPKTSNFEVEKKPCGGL